MLGRKQRISNRAFLRCWHHIEQIVTPQQIQRLTEHTVNQIVKRTHGQRVAYAWSGGKDSIVLRGVCEAAGIRSCMMGMSNLEYPAFLAWVTDNMPDRLTVINTGQDLAWLTKNLDMLFPQEARVAAKWFKIVQHKAQATYYKQNQLDMIILGRRAADGNYMDGGDGTRQYTSKGITRYSPIGDWRHEDVLGYIHYNHLPLPPIYRWPNGFVVGTGPWPARQWTLGVQHGWREVYAIDPDIVNQAADWISSARIFLDKKNYEKPFSWR